MKKLQTKAGLIAYHTTAAETTLIGGMGICDECGKAPPDGYLVPVLNHWQCPECFKDWAERAKYYPEDEPFERKNAAYYEARIPLTKSQTQGGGSLD